MLRRNRQTCPISFPRPGEPQILEIGNLRDFLEPQSASLQERRKNAS